MNVEIITIGDELLIGQVIDTNSAWMGQHLGEEGFRVIWRTTVGDVEEDMLEAFNRAMQRADIVLITGGIGPTNDDITKKTLCKYFGCGMHFSDEVFDNIQRIFNRSNRKMNELTRNQALVPDNCTIIQNRVGTAPCTWFERDNRILVSMPGVPSEMKWLMSNEITPRLKTRFNQNLFIRHQTCWVAGFTESALAIKLTDFEKQLPSFIKLAYLPQPGLIRLRLSAYTENEEEAIVSISEQREKLHAILAGNILVEEDKAIEVQIGDILRDKQLHMGTAESCTGGHIAGMITSVAGSSDYFVGGIISYSNEVKHRILGVSEESLSTYGAVSKEVVEQMVVGATRVLGCDCAVATSGIAGPGGGTEAKPVGTVWIAAKLKEKVVSECFHFGTIRDQNIQRASNTALLMLLKVLEEE
ncbi:MAG: competence/damage-inducible protein A [Parabacteroides sp.]|jgi:competence/damage-inducible protein CinA C-terminal domain|nr:competence/damage-inducible protein A [Parabacteroides sp.]